MMVKPITPAQVIKKKKDGLPPFVIEAFNTLIAKNFNGHSATIRQEDVLQVIMAAAPEGTTSDTVFNEHWLDVEDIFRKAGWTVRYDKPAYNETYEPTFEFTPKPSKN
jgi:hypothetical protein